MILPELPPNLSEWPLAAWDQYREAAGKHEAEGLTPSEASIRAQQEVRVWRRCCPDERAWLESLPAVTEVRRARRSSRR